MKVRDVLRLLKDDGWYLIVTEASHRQFKHAEKKGQGASQTKRRSAAWNIE